MKISNLFKRSGNNTPAPYQHISSDEAEKMKDVVFLDVRSPGEHASGHIPGSKLLNVMDPSFARGIEKLPKDKTYVVYCRSGNRSATACKKMADAGFENLYNLKGGMMFWNGKTKK